MVTPTNCPQCGSVLPQGANACPVCGHQLQTGANQPVEPPPDQPAYAPAGGPASASTTASATAAVNDFAAQTMERWNVQQSTILAVAGVLALIAVLVSTIAHISYLTAGENDFLQKIDASVWFNLAIGAAIGTAALVLLVRLQSGAPAPADLASPDFRAGAVLLGLIGLFCLFGLFKGLGEGLEAQDSWFLYARVFAFLFIALAIISRPIPDVINTMGAGMIGLALVSIGGVALVIGQFMGLSNDNSTHTTGLAFQGLGIVAMLVALGWFLGMDRRQA